MMLEAVDSALHAWDSYYVIVGSSAAALTGLQFVVMTLLDGARSRGASILPADSGSVNAFGTPTVVHFCATLLTAAILTAPWRSLAGVRTALVLAGAAGMAYAVVVIVRARRQTGYKPVLEDWLWHTTFPVVAYGGIVVGASILQRDAAHGLFVVGAMALFLLFIGIHNAWDTVTYLTVQGEQGNSAGPASPPTRRPQASGRRGRQRR